MLTGNVRTMVRRPGQHLSKLFIVTSHLVMLRSLIIKNCRILLLLTSLLIKLFTLLAHLYHYKQLENTHNFFAVLLCANKFGVNLLAPKLMKLTPDLLAHQGIFQEQEKVSFLLESNSQLPAFFLFHAQHLIGLYFSYPFVG